MMLVIDDEDFPELGREVLASTQEVDEIADGQVFRHRDHVAAHDTAGGVLRIGQRAFDGRAVFGLHFGEDGLLVLLVEVLISATASSVSMSLASSATSSGSSSSTRSSRT
jgi:hypothetical protein